MAHSRYSEIEILAGNGELEKLKTMFSNHFTQIEIDTALTNAIAYSQIETAKYLLSLGAKFSAYDYESVYYAVHNNEIEGLKFAIENGVDININDGILLAESIVTSYNEKDTTITKWLLDNGAKLSLLSENNIQLVKTFSNDELKKLLKIQ